MSLTFSTRRLMVRCQSAFYIEISFKYGNSLFFVIASVMLYNQVGYRKEVEHHDWFYQGRNSQIS